MNENIKGKKNATKESLKKTFCSTKYLMNFVWREKNGKKYVILKAVVSILNTIFPLVLILTPGLIINELIGEKRLDTLFFYIIVTTGIPLIQGVFYSCIKVYLDNLKYKCVLKIKVDFMEHCAEMDYSTLEEPEIQLLKDRAEETISNSLDTIDHLNGLLSAIINIVTCASIISIFNPLVFFTVFVSVIINFNNSRGINRESFLANKEIQKYNRYGWPILNYLSNINYAKEIRIFDLKNYFTNIYCNKRDEANKISIQLSKYIRNKNIIGAIVSFLQNIVLYVFFVYQVFTSKIAVGNVTICIGAILNFTNSLTNITGQYLKLSSMSLSVQDLINFLKIPLTNKEKGVLKPCLNADSVLEFQNVSFKYPGSKKETLKNVNLKIFLNQKLCIVGANGSGKSTFLKLLLRLYFPSEGKILLDGVNINKFDYSQYLRIFSPVFQDYMLYNLTIKENIIMAHKYDSFCFESATRQSGISNLVNKEYGYDTVIYKWHDEEGFEPSGGEAQKIAIARALYHGGEIYILDEPTAALDPNAEYEIYTQFHNMIKDKTAILITHRLSAVQLADKVAVFDDGHVAEYGTHAELYAKGGLYTEMFDKQAKFYRDDPSKNGQDPEPVQ